MRKPHTHTHTRATEGPPPNNAELAGEAKRADWVALSAAAHPPAMAIQDGAVVEDEKADQECGEEEVPREMDAEIDCEGSASTDGSGFDEEIGLSWRYVGVEDPGRIVDPQSLQQARCKDVVVEGT